MLRSAPILQNNRQPEGAMLRSALRYFTGRQPPTGVQYAICSRQGNAAGSTPCGSDLHAGTAKKGVGRIGDALPRARN